MKKSLLIAFAALCYGAAAQAQASQSFLEQFLKGQGIVLFPPGTQTQQHLHAAKTAGTASRLIQAYRGEATASGPSDPWDSVTYAYSNGRGGDLSSTPYIPFDVKNTYVVDSITGNYYQSATDTQLYNTAGQLVSNTHSVRAGAGFQYNRRDLYAYNGSGQLSSTTIQFWTPGTGWQSTNRDNFTYAANGDTATMLSEQWNTGAWANYSRRVYSHNASGQRTSITYGYWQTSAWSEYMRFVYTYNAAGLLTKYTRETSSSPSVWVPSYEYRNHYNAAGLITARATTALYAATPFVMDSVAIAYTTGSVPVLQDIHMYNSMSTVLTPMYKFTPAYNTAGLTATMQQDMWNATATAFAPYRRSVYFYNSFDQLTNEYTEKPSGSAWVSSPGTLDYRYYYSTYTTGIAGTKADLAFKLYPNPANNSLNIALQLDQPQELNIELTDVLGKRVYSRQEMAAGTYTKTLGTTALPAGTYQLTLGVGGARSTKLVSIQH